MNFMCMEDVHFIAQVWRDINCVKEKMHLAVQVSETATNFMCWEACHIAQVWRDIN